jgi:hypothetical protein
MASMESTLATGARGGQKFRNLELGVLAVATLSLPALSTLAVSATAAPRLPARGGPVRISPDSHRLALAVAQPNSLRLT